MAGKLLPDALWDEIEGLFPVYQPSPDGGRPPKEARTVLARCCSCSRRASLGKTCRKKRSSVRTRHVLGDLPSGRASASGSGFQGLFLAKLRGTELLNWSRVLVGTRIW